MAAQKVIVNVDAGIGEPLKEAGCNFFFPCIRMSVGLFHLTHFLSPDAGIALLAALRSPEIEVIGITTSFGVASPSQAIENTLRLVSNSLIFQPHVVLLCLKLRIPHTLWHVS